ncbi:MAG: PLP-dependent aminotransferase family protein [Defluviitaleaceae bacterium]|nr:PLP-dependent aminotransferase family protein [Defluviitaleaceae bacterium]
MSIYEQIANDIKQDIVDKKIKQGQRLPSLISLSKKYNCSKGSAIKAIEQLCSQHIVYSKPQSGYYVADNLIREEGSRTGYYLDSGNPVVGSLPIFDAHHCLHIAAEMYSAHSLDISLRGYPSLNAILPNYLALEDIYAKSENIHLFQGITQILTHLTLTPFPNGKETILIEEPTFRNYINFLKQARVTVITIKRDEHGIDLKQLEDYFKNKDIKFFYTTPRNHNPLGTSLTHRQRRKIMELAHKYNVYIVEDDYFGEAHKVPKYVPIYYFSLQKNCIYLRSMSKTIPMLRVALAVIPGDFISTFEAISKEAYYYSYFMPALISQATYEAYLKTSIYKKHFAQITQSINTKLELIREITSSWNPAHISLVGAKSGYYFTLKLARQIEANELIVKLTKKQVFITSNLDAFFYKENYDNSVRLSIARISLEHLRDALEIIYETVAALIDGK